MKEISGKRLNDTEFELNLVGEVVRLKPGKKAKAIVGLLVSDEENAGPRAMIAWFERALNREHAKNERKGIEGHGKLSIEGCQACRMWDRLDDDDDALELEDIFEASNWLMGEMSNSFPTGQPSV